MTTRPHLTQTQRRLAGVVVSGAVIIATIGFVGSYSAVRELATNKGFGEFARVFPIGIDAGIGVLLALDLLLTWLRIPYPLLRPAAWLLTIATIAFNAAAAWPDPIGVGMHAVIPLLFIVTIEAARHAIGRIADITADKHIEPVRMWRWILSPIPTFRLWRRMKLWELRSYPRVLKLEQDRLTYRAQLAMQHGRSWRRKASPAQLLPLRLSRIGVAPGPEESATPSFDRVADEAVAVAARPVAPRPPNEVPPGARLLPVICLGARGTAAPSATPPAAAAPPAMQHPMMHVATHPVAVPHSPAQLLTVADVAALRGVTPGTVRSWVNRGKLTPAARDSNGRNTFHPDAVAALDAPPATLDAPPATPSQDNGVGQGGGGYN